MVDRDDVPLCAEQIFMYPGKPGSMGTLDYAEDDYRNNYPDLDFINRKHILEALEDDVETRDVDLFTEAEEARFKIPDYQRHYSWEKEDHRRLWYKLLQITQLETGPGPQPPENFFGTIYVGELADRERYEVIDGQQRLTTIAILLECMRREFDTLIPNLSGDIKELATHIQQAWIEGILLRQQGPKEVPFIRVSSHDIDFFEVLFNESAVDRVDSLNELTGFDGRKKHASTLEEVIEKLEIPSWAVEEANEIDEDTLNNSYVYFAESHELLADAFSYYESQLQAFLTNDERFPTDEHAAHALINLSLFILRSFRISEIMFSGDNKELRVNVFQELNDAGKPLTTKDKIKARIVSLFQQSDSYAVSDELETWEDTVQRFADKSARVERFLVMYVQATRNPDGAKHARENLLDLFRLTDVGGHEFTPQLTSPSDGHDFLEELNRYSQRYTEIKDLSLDGGSHPLDDEVRKRSEEIVRRLDNLNTTQWIPFILYLYDDVSSTPGKGEFFHQVLQTVESLIFRVSLSEVRTTVIEDTFMESAADFRRASESNDLAEYDAETISEFVLENVEENRQLNGETFADTIIRSRDWSNKRAKQLLMKLVDEQFGEDEGMTRRDLSEDVSIDVEHTLPLSFIRDSNTEDPYAWLSDFFPEDGDTLSPDSNLFDLIKLLEEQGAADIDANDEMYDRLQRIQDHIESVFVRDLGNMMILEGGVNRSVQNRRFALKLRAYHEKHPEDIKNPVNRFFSTENNEITTDDINALINLSPSGGYDDTEATLQEIEDEYNGWWNIDRMVERKAEIIRLILESLTFQTTNEDRSEEFDEIIDDSTELEQSIREDLRKRAEQAI